MSKNNGPGPETKADMKGAMGGGKIDVGLAGVKALPANNGPSDPLVRAARSGNMRRSSTWPD